MSWEPQALPDQTGKVALVTGANAGVGYFISEQLARAGVHVILACRNEKRADAALRAIRGRVPGASAEVLILDLADLAAVRSAASAVRDRDRLDLLIQNAGLTDPPAHREALPDGNELVLTTNVLGHFALAAGALPVLERSPAGRIVAMGSLATKLSTFHEDDIALEVDYSKWRAYAQSKIAAQSIGFELDRRLRAAGSTVSSLVAHPGYAVDGLAPRIQGVNEPGAAVRFGDHLQSFFGVQGKDRGAWPAVRAALDPNARGGQFWGPRLLVGGRPVLQTPTRTSTDPRVAAKVWAQAEQYADTTFDLT